VAWSEQALAELGEALSGFGETGADMRVLIQWGPWIKDDRRSWMPDHHYIRIDADTVNLVVANWHAGKSEDATMLLMEAFLKRYPLPGAEAREVDVYELRLQPASAEPNRP
jgi:hypothetical protein